MVTTSKVSGLGKSLLGRARLVLGRGEGDSNNESGDSDRLLLSPLVSTPVTTTVTQWSHHHHQAPSGTTGTTIRHHQAPLQTPHTQLLPARQQLWQDGNAGRVEWREGGVCGEFYPNSIV